MEMKLSFGFACVQFMNTIHHTRLLDGDLISGGILMFMFAHFRIGWMMLEQLWHEDFNVFTRNLWNDAYLGPIMSITMCYLVQIFLFSANLHIYYFHNFSSVSDLFLTDMHRPKLRNYQILSHKNPDHVMVYTLSNICFGVPHLWTAIRTVWGLR